MIESLRIDNLAIVEEAELEFGPGLNVLTGETGAGKSIVLGALSLLVGARATPGTLRDGAESGGVEALFATEGLPDLEASLRDRDLADPSPGAADPDAHALVVRRSLTASGRSRARIGGQLVPVSTLADLFAGRVEISSQHSSQALRQPEAHGRLLDAAGGLLGQRERVGACFEAVRALDEELEQLRADAAERERQRDFIAYQLAEIEEVGLAPGELETVDTDHARLAHAEALAGEGAAAVQALRGDDVSEGSGAVDRIAAASRAVERMARMDAGLGDLLERLRGLEAEAGDVLTELERYLEAIEGDPAGLAQLEERIGQIERLRRKYGQGESEIFAERDRLAASLDAIEGADGRIEALAARRADLLADLAEAARKLTAGRKKAARSLARAVEQGLRELAMPEARFAVSLDAKPSAAGWPEGVASGPNGAEAPEFLLAANKGESPRSLQRVASGGELSRVFLAVKNALRQAGGGMVLVFDEVDAGIGGRAAERVGRALSELAAGHQVVCITHLPQIAAFANRHFLVEKSQKGKRTRVRVHALDDSARVEEIARMAGGAAITKATRDHARSLIAAAAAAAT